MLTIILSGPKASAPQARTALAGAGFEIGPDAVGHSHGLADTVSGEETAEPQEFVTVHGDDIDAAYDAVRPLGWALRMHHDAPEPVGPSADQILFDRLANLEREIAELKSGRLGIPPIGGGAVESPPAFLQAGSYGAEQSRRAIASMLARGASIGSIAGGLVGSTDCQITAGSGMQISMAPGEAWVPGSTSATQSGYYCRVSSTTTLAIATSDPSNPRVDRVSAVVTDAAYSGASNTFAVAVETGTPTAGATLVNLSGVAAAPASSYTLGYVLVPAASASVTNGNISNVATVASLDSGMMQGIAAAGLSPALAQSAVVNQSGQTVKGASVIATSESRTNVAYGTLTTPDQVTGIVLPTNGLIVVWYQATWQESVQAASRAAIFVGANQLRVSSGGANPFPEAAATNAAGGGGFDASLFTIPGGLASFNNGGSAYAGDLATGQVVGGYVGSPMVTEVNGSVGSTGSGNSSFGGPCYIFAAAGTYTISVQFKASSGSVTAKNRKLWAQAVSFA